MSHFKLSITIQSEDEQVLTVFPFDSSTALEEKLHQLHTEYFVVKEHWLLNAVITVKQPPHENPLLRELGPEAFEAPQEEITPVEAFEEPVEEIFVEEIEAEEIVPVEVVYGVRLEDEEKEVNEEEDYED